MEDEDLSWMNADDGTDDVGGKVRTATRKRNKLIMLDDLLRERERKKRQQSRNRQASNTDDDSSSTDDDDDVTVERKATMVKRMLKDLESESTALEEKVSLQKWGEKVFYVQTSLEIPITTSDDCLQVSSEMDLSMDGLLLRGMLRSWVIAEGRCDEKTTRWIYLQMVQSPNEQLEKAACQFLCDLLILRRADSNPICQFEWLPTFMDIQDVFRHYGYRKVPIMEDGKSLQRTGRSCDKTVCDPASKSNQLEGPPPNIRSFVVFLRSLFQTRQLHRTFSASEAEELVVMLAHCQMDRCVETISSSFRLCLKALVNYFTEEEWVESCPQIASRFSSISSNVLNQVRAAKTLNTGDSRLCSLQKLLVVFLLGKNVEKNIQNAADVVSIFKSIETKRKDFDFLNLFHQLTMADLYLWSEPRLEKDGSIHRDWLERLKRITLSISSSDERTHATKARNWASFLHQKYQF